MTGQGRAPGPGPGAPVYNFSAGPACLPEAVMEQARDEFLDFEGTGLSILETSHRSTAFSEGVARPKPICGRCSV